MTLHTTRIDRGSTETTTIFSVGGDLTYHTSRFRGSKTLEAGVWALTTDREGLERDRSAVGASVAYDGLNLSL